METIVEILLIVLLLTAASLAITHSLPIPVLIGCSFLCIALPIVNGLIASSAIVSATCLLLVLLAIYRISIEKPFTLGKKKETKRWRVIIRPAAVLFIPISEFLGHYFLVYLLGILCSIFIAADLYRLFAGKKFKRIYKGSETRRFSSMTSFLVSMFIVFLLFRDEIAYLCLVFIIFGDLFAKIAGLSFGRTRIIHRRTLEGSLGFLSGSLYAGAIVASLFGIPLLFLLTGVVIATIVELLSYHVDDNFTVGILTGGGLVALEYFGVLA